MTRPVVWVYGRYVPKPEDPKAVRVYAIWVEGGTDEEKLAAATEFLQEVPLEVLANA